MCGLLLLAAVVALIASSGAAHAERPVAGSVTSERLKLPSGPSSVRGLAGEPSVDPFTSQVGYEVPIELPGGYGRLAPSLALGYSGALGNGPVGIGWSLSQAKIQRSTRLGVPRFDDSDELELSGIVSGRLISIGNGEYRVEGMGQTVRVTRVGAGFEVDDGRGVHYQLGASAAARQDRDASHTLSWQVETQTNQMGEQIHYEYAADRGQIYLTRVTWGPRGVYSVELEYEGRGDATRSYREGFLVVTAQRLATVRVSAFGSERRAYHLGYDGTHDASNDPSFQISRLSGVSSTGVAGQGAWPALAFSYATPAAPAVTPIGGIGTWRLNGNGTTLVDLDGDGAADLLQLADGGHSYLPNQNGTFGKAQALTGNTQSISALQLQDLDGDARAELVQDTGSGWVVWRFTKTQWVKQTGIWPGSAHVTLKDPAVTRFADLNGDGVPDVIQWDNDNLKVGLATRTGLPDLTSLPRIGGAVLPTQQGRFQDTNGDGLDDYVVVGTDRLDVYLGHGDGTFEPAQAVAYPFAGTVADPANIELGDLDRDGLIDLVKVDLGTVRWYRGRAGGGFTTAVVTVNNPEQLSASVVVTLADINGNGSLDVVWSSTSGMWRMDIAGTTTAGMLIGADNGLGMHVALDYQSSHALSVAARVAADPWAIELPIAMPVVVQKTTTLGPGETSRLVSYGVRDGFWDAAEQRFGGFRTTTVTTAGATAAQTSTVFTRYNAGTGANRVLRGKPLTEQVKDGTGQRLSLTTSTWETMAIAGLPDTPLLRRAVLRAVQVQYDGTTPVHKTDVTCEVRKTDVTHSYDPLGRPTHTVDSGRCDLSGDESVTDTTYVDDATTWVRDQICEEKISSIDGVLVSDVQHLFGDETQVLALRGVGKGWPRVTQAWLASENRFVVSSQTAYDIHGNAVSVTSHGVERRMVYDADGLFPIEEHLTAPSGRELIWQASYDRVLGAVSALTDPNGHTTHVYNDSLGRYTGNSIDDHRAHQVIEYDWTAPYPKTTTWLFDGALAEVTDKPAAWSADSHWRQAVEVANGKGDARYHALRIASDQWIVSAYQERDANARVVFEGRPIYTSQLELSARPTDAQGHPLAGDTLVYDPLGRLIEQDLATGTKRTYSYVAFERTMQDADLAPVHSVLDGQGRALSTERSLPDGTHEIVQASYDAAGRLTQMSLTGDAVVRSFTYDTLGRLIQSSDPDLGIRTLAWDDGNRLRRETNAAGQSTLYTYDSLGRLSTRDAGGMIRYHYDDARPGVDGIANLAGQLAWVEEPTGGLDLGYDELGHGILSRQRIDDQVSELTTAYAVSGLVLHRSFSDGFALDYRYDPAGRMTDAGELWHLLDQDASGQPIHERAGNGVDTRFGRDILGLASRVTVKDTSGTAIYDVEATRNPWTAITAVTDHDGVGLDHSATFGYDSFARLISATAGSGAAALSFGYSYDVLHNMTSRTANRPSALTAFFGTYRYGEAGQAPRQLSSIADASGHTTHTFHYDAAGRQTGEDDRVMSYDPMDRLVRVDGVAGGSVQHTYGQDGTRVKTIAPDGARSYFFGDGTAIRNGVREHDVSIGSRAVARITMSPAAAAGAGSATAITGALAPFGMRGLGLLALGIALFGLRGRLRQRARAAGMIGLALAASCVPSTGTVREQLTSVQVASFLHAGFSAGPAVYTDAVGGLLEERRYEPFGAAIDAHLHRDVGDVVGAPNVVARDLNALNKRTEAATGWSDHGARWMAPQTGRWLTPDPPVEGPDPASMLAPWGLHPYQYVEQNPVVYWDPDGRDKAHVDNLQIYLDWKDAWSARNEAAQGALEAVRDRLQSEHGAAWYAEGIDRFRRGQSGALGPEYQQVSGVAATASAQISATSDVRGWLEAQGAKGIAPTMDQVNAWAGDIAPAKAKYVDLFFTVVTAGYPSLRAFGAGAAVPPPRTKLWEPNVFDIPPETTLPARPNPPANTGRPLFFQDYSIRGADGDWAPWSRFERAVRFREPSPFNEDTPTGSGNDD